MTDYNEIFSLKGKTALITGGTGGLGSAIARAFLQQALRSLSAVPVRKKRLP